MAATGSETGFELASHPQSRLRPKLFALTCGMRPHIGHGGIGDERIDVILAAQASHRFSMNFCDTPSSAGPCPFEQDTTK